MPDARQYSMSLRDTQTAATRSRILDAAGDLFAEHGYLGTTITKIAKAAGVSVQTIYNLAGSKPVLLKAVYDITLAGDDEPIPMTERPLVKAVMRAPTGPECLARYATMGRVIGERVLPLVTMVLAQAATGDPELQEFATTIETERGHGTRGVATHIAATFGLREGMDTQTAADILWTLTSSDITDRLVNQRSWGWDRYEQWLATTMADAVLRR